MPRWKKILYALLAAVTVTAAGWLTAHFADELNTCVDGIERVGDECIGVNGDGYDFGNPEIRNVARAIAEQNDAVEDESHVTVAMMLPLQSDSAAMRRQMRSDLQGAYLGQLQANKGEGEPPKIRLVLANPGRAYDHQKKVVDTLLQMAGSSEGPLRAVTGFNLSLDKTKAAMDRLTEEKIPVLASRISGDGLANEDSADGTEKPRFPGLARILPTNQAAAKALAHFNREQSQQDRKTVLVYDRRDDSYNESLVEAFGRIEEDGPPGPAAMAFDSPAINELGDTGNKFEGIAHNICASGADTVYFAGRSAHLRLFALKLAQVVCEDRDYTVISGSDAASLRQGMKREHWEDLRGEDGEPKVKVQYAAPAHPDAWDRELAEWKQEWEDDHGREPTEEELPQYLTEPRDALATLKERIADARDADVRLRPEPDLEDSRTMLVYDGLVTVGKALHQAQQGGAEQVPGAAEVGTQWSLFHSAYRVRGTSGLICLTSGGNPYDKPVAVVELDPGREGRGELKFLGLGWPEGREQPENCVIPGRGD